MLRHHSRAKASTPAPTLRNIAHLNESGSHRRRGASPGWGRAAVASAFIDAGNAIRVSNAASFSALCLFFRHRFDKVGSMTVIRLTKNAPGRITAE
jgi:hypothetical protein